MLDLADGVLSSALKAEIATALLQLPVATITANLNQRLLDTGADFTAPDMNRVSDQDMDGVINRVDISHIDNCPLVPNPLQENGDGDPHGDACDDCLVTACPDGCLPAGEGNPSDACYAACREDDCTGDDICATVLQGDGTPATRP